MEQFDATKDDILAVLHPLSSPLSLSLVVDEFSFPYYIIYSSYYDDLSSSREYNNNIQSCASIRPWPEHEYTFTKDH